MAGYEETIVVSLPELYSIAGAQVDVTAATKALDQAQTVIETISGVVFDADFRDLFLKKSDALWIKRATVFQAAWLLEQQDALTRIGANSITQDGISVSSENDLTFVLAPLAKRALQNCSWTKSGTQRVSTDRKRIDIDYTVSDDHPWSPLGGI